MAQSPWVLLGNLGTDPVIDFVGTLDDEDLRFRTDDTFRMGITGVSGFLGLNITNPSSLFHMNNGCLLATGTTGANPDLGAGTRMMWIPSSGSFRAGQAVGTEWNSGNVGQNSFATGNDVTASGQNSFAAGNNVTASGLNSIALGSQNNIASAQSSTSIGFGNNVSALGSMALGRSNVISNQFSFAFGCDIQNTAAGTITIGTGTSFAGSDLLNNVMNSIMLGTNSNLPTMIITQANGSNTIGRVGIGLVDPEALLDVNADYTNEAGAQFGERIEVVGGLDESYGLLVTMDNATPGVLTETYGVYAESQGSPVRNFGGYFIGTNGTGANSISVGCQGDAVSNASFGIDNNFGVVGNAQNSFFNIGVSGNASGSDTGTILNIGVSGSGLTSPNTVRTVGVTGGARANHLNSGSNPADIIGVSGAASLSATTSDTPCSFNLIGVYGQAPSYICESPTAALSYAGYFQGDVFVTANLTAIGTISGSDENLKSDIQDLNSTIDKVMQLNPRTYTWNQSASNTLQLPEGQDLGFVAQEVEELYPELVKSFRTMPERNEETGELIHESEEWLGIKYNGFFPILTKAIQEQQAIIEEQESAIDEQNDRLSDFEEALNAQQDQLDALSAELAACCTSGLDQRSGAVEDDIRLETLPTQDRLEQNAPNPFSESTTLRFTLGSEKHTRVCIYNSTGQLIDCLVDDTRPAGNHRVDWNTSDLASGIYFYSLEVDGFEQVRRAIKL